MKMDENQKNIATNILGDAEHLLNKFIKNIIRCCGAHGVWYRWHCQFKLKWTKFKEKQGKSTHKITTNNFGDAENSWNK